MDGIFHYCHFGYCCVFFFRVSLSCYICKAYICSMFRCFDVCKCVCVRLVCRPVNSIELALERVSFEQQNSFRNAKELANDEKIARAHTHTHGHSFLSVSPFLSMRTLQQIQTESKSKQKLPICVCIATAFIYTHWHNSPKEGAVSIKVFLSWHLIDQLAKYVNV